MGMKAWKEVQLRQTHGAMHATKRKAARAARARATGLFGEPMRIQMPQTGRKRSSVELERAMSAHKSPKSSHWGMDCRLGVGATSPTARMRRASTSTAAKRKVLRDVSQTQRVAYCMAAG